MRYLPKYFLSTAQLIIIITTHNYKSNNEIIYCLVLHYVQHLAITMSTENICLRIILLIEIKSKASVTVSENSEENSFHRFTLVKKILTSVSKSKVKVALTFIIQFHF